MRNPIIISMWLMVLLIIFVPHSYGQPSLRPLTTGTISYLDAQLEKFIPRSAKLEIIGSGFQHIEGPVWLKDSNTLLFSDTKGQIIYRWAEGKSYSKFLENTGFTGRLPYGEEPGSNGLAVDNKGNLIVCEHGDRRIALFPLKGDYGFSTLADNINGRRFNSPNDVVVKKDGSIYFTDPPYGLPKADSAALRQTAVNGVYRIDATGKVKLLTGDIAHPNGIALSTLENILYISDSDEESSKIWAYPLYAGGYTGKRKLFFSGQNLPKEQAHQVLDGLKTDKDGNVWACGPGGLLIISPAGKLLGTVSSGEIMSNCAWGNDGTTLYITAGYFLYRLKTNAKGNF